MEIGTRKLFNRSFTFVSVVSIVFMSLALVVLLGPIFVKGSSAFVFRATIEHRKLMLERFDRGDRAAVEAEKVRAEAARKPVLDLIRGFEAQLDTADVDFRRRYRDDFKELKGLVAELFGPMPGEEEPVLLRQQYGQTRWDRAKIKLQGILFTEEYDYSDPTKMGVKVLKPRVDRFRGTSLEPLFGELERGVKDMLRPRLTWYWRFLFDESYDSHFFGGIWPEMLGTIYLVLGAMLFAVPLGIVTAIYLAEYAGESHFVSMLRTCISSLAGVPSIVFGLFGLAFFINTMKVSQSKSVLAGALTLAVLVLPTVIRASEEAIKAVPLTYKEASMSLGASKWRTILTVILPGGAPRSAHERHHQHGKGRGGDGAHHLHRRGERRQAARRLADLLAADARASLEHLQSRDGASGDRRDTARPVRHGSHARRARSDSQPDRHRHTCSNIEEAERLGDLE